MKTLPTLLLVDDDPEIREQMKWALASDYELLEASDRPSALRSIRQGMPQIMTGGSEKARFADVGPFRFRLRGLQCFALALDLGDVIDRHQDLPPR